MQYRCHECGELFESHHTNYKYAKGFHPKDNPENSAVVAKELDHCTNCQALRSYDPVWARERDLVAAAGTDTGFIANLQGQLASLKAQIEASKQERAVAQNLQEQIADLRKTLGVVSPVTPAGA